MFSSEADPSLDKEGISPRLEPYGESGSQDYRQRKKEQRGAENYIERSLNECVQGC
jgi:hypothetical protein